MKSFVCSLVAAVFLFAASPAASAQVTPEQVEKIKQALPDKPVKKPKKDRKLLIFTLSKTYKHDSIPFASTAFTLMSEKTGAFTVELSNDMAAFEKANLARFDAILLNNTTSLTFDNPKYRENLLEFVKNGKGLMGIHAASDNFYTWPEAAELIGGYFDGHPWVGNGTWQVKVDEPGHVCNKGFSSASFRLSDEIYRIKQFNLRKNSRVIVSLDPVASVNMKAEGVRSTDKDLPISWLRDYGKGRVFYCSFGHNPAIYWNKEILAHYLAGLQFAFGDLEAETTPVPFKIGSALDFDEFDKNLASLADYKYGQSLADHKDIREFVTFASQDKKVMDAVEAKLISFLQSDASVDGKQLICHLLASFGSKKSVNTLSKMLYDSSTVEMARFALEGIQDASAGNALREAALKLHGDAQVGVINALGNRKDEKAVSELSKLMNSENIAVADAAITALGKIANDQAIAELKNARQKSAADRRPALTFSLLNAADQLLAQKKITEAHAIYKQLFAKQEAHPIRYAALRGIVQCNVDDTGALLIEVLRNDTPALRQGVAMIVHDLPADQDIRGIVAALPSLSAADQARLLGVMSARKDAELLKMALQLSKSDDAAVREAAFELIGKIGDENTVSYLAEVAANNKDDATAARKALVALSGDQVDSKIASLLPEAQKETRLQLINSLRMRRAFDKDGKIAEMLLQSAMDEDASIRLASLRALQNIADARQVETLTGLLLKTSDEKERSTLETTIVAAVQKNGITEEKNQSATKIVMNAYTQTKDSETRQSCMMVLAKIGHDSSLPVLTKAMSESDAALKTAAIRALSEWPNDKPVQALEGIIRDSDNVLDRSLAMRGYVRMLGASSERPEEQTAGLFEEALKLARNDSEKKMVLSGLSNQTSYQAFVLAKTQLAVPALRDEAEIAVVQIAESTLGAHPEEVKAVLQQILAESENATLKEDAQRYINRIEKFEGFITLWQLSGPYTHSTADIFHYEFPPEKADGNAEWTNMTEISDKTTPWLVNMTNIYGGSFCAGYMRVYVWSEKEREAQLELGSNDGIRAWLNDKLIHSNDASRGVTPADDVVNINLNKGWNTLMLKINQTGGSWGACARIRSLEGSEIKDLKYQLEMK
ncbi:MAG: ThuA domain-containing protein [Deferribacteres bacterium]|nr:ThuA domain-containing protein [candidate division KSB1 bacterium]MCB9502015.1 ThuA domain-containing protein [Deferribacteres bacterium]